MSETPEIPEKAPEAAPLVLTPDPLIEYQEKLKLLEKQLATAKSEVEKQKKEVAKIQAFATDLATKLEALAQISAALWQEWMMNSARNNRGMKTLRNILDQIIPKDQNKDTEGISDV